MPPTCRRDRPLSLPAVAATLAVLALALPGCPARQSSLDTSAVGPGVYAQAYEGRLAVFDYDGPASYVQVGGDLPAGLSMNEAGVIRGEPELAGSWTANVRASQLKGLDDVFGEVTIDVGIGDQPDAFLGHRRDQLTQLAEFALLEDMWVRPTGGGDESMNSYTVSLGVYLPGPDGVAKGGLGDDVLIGEVDPSEASVDVGEWEPVPEADPHPGYPSGHYHERDAPAYYAGDGEFRSWGDTGQMEVTFTHPTYGVDETRLLVTPPDWCPNGHQVGDYWQDPFAACE